MESDHDCQVRNWQFCFLEIMKTKVFALCLLIGKVWMSVLLKWRFLKLMSDGKDRGQITNYFIDNQQGVNWKQWKYWRQCHVLVCACVCICELFENTGIVWSALKSTCAVFFFFLFFFFLLGFLWTRICSFCVEPLTEYPILETFFVCTFVGSKSPYLKLWVIVVDSTAQTYGLLFKDPELKTDVNNFVTCRFYDIRGANHRDRKRRKLYNAWKWYSFHIIYFRCLGYFFCA